MYNPFIDPDSKKVINFEVDGTPFWIEVRGELSASEQAAIDAAPLTRLAAQKDGKVAEFVLDLADQDFKMIAAWITNWSLTDAGGRRIKPRMAEYTRLTSKMAGAIIRLVRAHAKEASEAAADTDGEPITDPLQDTPTTMKGDSSSLELVSGGES